MSVCCNFQRSKFSQYADFPVSNHHGNGNPDLTGGFDRTFGPVRLTFLVEVLRLLTANDSPITISTKPPREPRFRHCVLMPESSRTRPGMRSSTIPLLNTSQATSKLLAVVLGKVKLHSRPVSPAPSPSLPAMASTSKTTTSTRSRTSTGVISARTVPLHCLALRPERTA